MYLRRVGYISLLSIVIPAMQCNAEEYPYICSHLDNHIVASARNGQFAAATIHLNTRNLRACPFPAPRWACDQLDGFVGISIDRGDTAAAHANISVLRALGCVKR